MIVVWYLIFFAISYFLLKQIFRFSTYHAYFFKSLPFLAGYSILVGYLLFRFNLHQFFLWHIVVNALLLALLWRKQAKQVNRIIEMVDGDAERANMKLSVASTRAYYFLSVLVYLICFSASFLYFFNAQFWRQ